MTNKTGKRPSPPASMVVLPSDEPIAASILSAAVTVFGARGYHGTTVRDIVDEAGVSPGSLYNYFDSKQSVLVTILDRAIDALIYATEDAMYHAERDPAARLKATVGAVVRVFASEPVIGRIGEIELLQVNRNDRRLILSKRASEQRIFDRIIADGVKQSVFQTKHPRYTSLYIVSACTGVGSWYKPSGHDTVDEVVAKYQAIALDSVHYTPEADVS